MSKWFKRFVSEFARRLAEAALKIVWDMLGGSRGPETAGAV
jgi:hypothetical protein